MFTKRIEPIIVNGVGLIGKQVTGTKVDYRFFGILIYRKTMLNPSYYGLTEWSFDYRI